MGLANFSSSITWRGPQPTDGLKSEPSRSDAAPGPWRHTVILGIAKPPCRRRHQRYTGCFEIRRLKPLRTPRSPHVRLSSPILVSRSGRQWRLHRPYISRRTSGLPRRRGKAPANFQRTLPAPGPVWVKRSDKRIADESFAAGYRDGIVIPHDPPRTIKPSKLTARTHLPEGCDRRQTGLVNSILQIGPSW